MKLLFLMLALTLASTMPVAALDQSDQAAVVAKVQQFVGAVNKGDLKAAAATCAPGAIIDEFAPYAWRGAHACSDWGVAFRAFNQQNKITGGKATLGPPRQIEISGNHAYVVAPASFSYTVQGKTTVETGAVFTAVLQKHARSWEIAAWTWSAGAPNEQAAGERPREIRAAFNRFVDAQNAHDLAAVGKLLWDSPDFLWVSRSETIFGRSKALAIFEQRYAGTWHLDPVGEPRIAMLTPDVAQLSTPMDFMIGAPQATPSVMHFIMNQTWVKTSSGWVISTLLPIPVPTPPPATKP